MDYQSLYNRIIEKARNEVRAKGGEIYFESHHILPKSMDGDDSYDNLVLLTAREHYMAHKLLWKIYGNRQTLSAYIMMCNRNGLTTSREYQFLREQSSKMSSQYMIDLKANNPDRYYQIIESMKKGFTEEHRRAIGERTTQYFKNKENRIKYSKFGKKQWEDPKHREIMAEKMKEVYSRPEVIEKMSISAKNRPSISNDTRRRHSQAKKAIWSNEEYRIKMIDIKNSQITKTKNKDSNRKRWKDEDYKNKMIEKRNSSEYKEKIRKSKEDSKYLRNIIIVHDDTTFSVKEYRNKFHIGYSEIRRMIEDGSLKTL